MSTYRGVVGAFSVIVKTGCGTDGALHSSLHFTRAVWRLVTEPGLRRDTALTLPMDWPSPTGDPANKANPGLI